MSRKGHFVYMRAGTCRKFPDLYIWGQNVSITSRAVYMRIKIVPGVDYPDYIPEGTGL
jgi:hypothetical protein